MSPFFGRSGKNRAVWPAESSNSTKDPPKNRRLDTDSSASDSDSPTKLVVSSISKAKKRKGCPLGSPPDAGPKEKQVRRADAQSQLDVVSKISGNKDKKDLQTNPVGLRRTSCPVSAGSSQGMTTPKLSKGERGRHTTSSPHPGALFKDRQIQSTPEESQEDCFTPPPGKKMTRRNSVEGTRAERRDLSEESELRRRSYGSLVDAVSSPSSTRILRQTPERIQSVERLKKSARLSAGMPVATRNMKRAHSGKNLSKSRETQEEERMDEAVVEPAVVLPSEPDILDVEVVHSPQVAPPLTSQSSVEVLFECLSTATTPPAPCRQSSSIVILSEEDVVPCSQEEIHRSQEMECSQPEIVEIFSSQEVVPCSQEIEEIVPCPQEPIEEIILSSQETICLSEGSTLGEESPQRPDLALKSALKTPGSERRKIERRVQFSSLQIYYFGRMQVSHVVPDHGDLAIGMEASHFHQREIKVLKTHRPSIGMVDPEESDLSEGEDPGAIVEFGRKRDFYKDDEKRLQMLQDNGIGVFKQRNVLKKYRESRKDCGCGCPGGVCKPGNCRCSQAGIPCQFDGFLDNRSFPCKCETPNLCGNENGRVHIDFQAREERLKAIQLFREREETVDAPRERRFSDQENEANTGAVNTKTPTREDFLLDLRAQGTPIYRLPRDDPPTTPTHFFPPSGSLL